MRAPTLALNAVDDPFIEARTLPTSGDVGPDGTVRLVFSPSGGHCGFISAEPPPHAAEGSPLQRKDWLAEELARFIEHCESFPRA